MSLNHLVVVLSSIIMATVELDPQFIKALRLLRSKSKDSGAQLRAMLDEAIRSVLNGLILNLTNLSIIKFNYW